ncbi:MAG: YibE/F family protein [Hespellia sp.]|nr:YibE/F family protein [Hespellia sp.]
MKDRTFFDRHRLQIGLFTVLLVIVFFAFHDSFLYSKTIGKVTEVHTETSGNATNYNTDNDAAKETLYTQTLMVKLLNGKYKGQKIKVSSDYAFSRIDSEKYCRGDRVFLNVKGEDKVESATISGVKRDQYAVLLVAVLIFLVLCIAGKRGVRAIASLLLNIGIFAYSMFLYEKGADLVKMSYLLVVIFTVATVLIVNGPNRRSFAAILSTLLTTFFAIGVFYQALHFGGEIDYASLDYVTGGQDVETIFLAGICLTSLGAVMDVAISIAAGLNEVMEKKPDVKLRQLLTSGREIGYDITGTMVNVLFFTYVCGLFPVLIIKLKNSIRLLTIVRLQIPFEIARFLIGGISILLAIPMSIVVTTVVLKLRRRKKEVQS